MTHVGASAGEANPEIVHRRATRSDHGSDHGSRFSRELGPADPTGLPTRREFPVPKPLESHGPARIIALCNQKGGVGKTTTTINLGAALAEYGRTVLAVDFDPQGALSAGLGVRPHDVADDLRPAARTGTSPPTAILHTGPTGLDVHPGEHRPLGRRGAPRQRGRPRADPRPACSARSSDDYDVILIDCQPSLGLLTVNALTAAHGVLIPLECEFFALRGVALLRRDHRQGARPAEPAIRARRHPRDDVRRAHPALARCSSASSRRSATRCSRPSSRAP